MNVDVSVMFSMLASELPENPLASEALEGGCNFPGGALMLHGWKKGTDAGLSRLGPPGLREVEQKVRAAPIKSAEELAAELGKLTFTNTVEESHRRKGCLDDHRENSIAFCPRLGFLDSAQARLLMSTETVQELVALSKDGALAGLTSGGGFFYGQNVKIQEYKGPLAKMTEFASLKICDGEQNKSGEEAVVAVVDDTGGNFFLSRPLPTADYAKSRVFWLKRLFDLLTQEVTTQVLAACDYFAQVDGDYIKILSYDDKNGGPAGGFCLQALLVGQNVWLWDKIRHEGRADDIDCIQREKRLSDAWVEAMLKRLEESMQTVQVVLRCQEADLRKQRIRTALISQLVILRGALVRYQTDRFESPEDGMLSEKLEAFGGMTGNVDRSLGNVDRSLGNITSNRRDGSRRGSGEARGSRVSAGRGLVVVGRAGDCVAQGWTGRYIGHRRQRRLLWVSGHRLWRTTPPPPPSHNDALALAFFSVHLLFLSCLRRK
jgi:hypothetical protein